MVVAVVAALAFCFPSLSTAETIRAIPQDFREMVALYASGKQTEARALLAGFSEERLRHHLDFLSDAVVTVRKCPACPLRLAFSRFPIRAALLLHADREIEEQFPPPVSEQVSQCGMGRHSIAVEHLASLLLLIDPRAGDFLRPLFLGMARAAQWSHCFDESQKWARIGLKTYASDAPLWMAVGIAAETGAFFTLGPAPRALNMTAATNRQREAMEVNLRELRITAQKAFAAALGADPDLPEGRLRLGRLLFRLGKGAAARVAFEAVLMKSSDPDLLYLAHLFLGRVLEDNNELTEAEGHYQIALSMEPSSETASVAVAHIRFLQGDTEGARETLGVGLVAVRRRTTLDPWVAYLVTQTDDGERILAELRRALVP